MSTQTNETPVATVPPEKQQEVLEAGHPLQSARGRLKLLTQVFRIIFNFPGFWNIRSAKKICDTGAGDIIGGNKFQYGWSLFPAALIEIAVVSFFPTPEVFFWVGTIWVFHMFAFICIMADDVVDAFAGAFFIGGFAAITLGLVLQFLAGFDVASTLSQVLHRFNIQFGVGICGLLTLLCFIGYVFSFFKATKTSGLRVLRGSVKPILIGSTTAFTAANYDIVAKIMGWEEFLVTGGGTIFIVAHNENADPSNLKDLERKSTHIVPDVAAVTWVEKAITFTTVKYSTMA